MKKHEWREKSEDGRVRRVRASHHAGRWTLQTKDDDDAEWTVHDPAPTELLQALRERLFFKYQRRRVAWETVADLDKRIGTPQDPP